MSRYSDSLFFSLFATASYPNGAVSAVRFAVIHAQRFSIGAPGLFFADAVGASCAAL